MKRVFPVFFIFLALLMAGPVSANQYAFPVGMKVTLEKGSAPQFQANSNLVFPVTSYFSYEPAVGETATSFVLFKNGEETLTTFAMGDRFQIDESVGRDDEVTFAPDSETAPKPIRVLVTDPIAIGHIHFEPGSAKLTEDARDALNVVAAEMIGSDLLGALLVGRTDRAGSEMANLSLSERRVAAARKYLKQALEAQGSNDFALKTEGVGEYFADTADGVAKARERRVSIIIYSHS